MIVDVVVVVGFAKCFKWSPDHSKNKAKGRMASVLRFGQGVYAIALLPNIGYANPLLEALAGFIVVAAAVVDLQQLVLISHQPTTEKFYQTGRKKNSMS